MTGRRKGGHDAVGRTVALMVLAIALASVVFALARVPGATGVTEDPGRGGPATQAERGPAAREPGDGRG